MRKLKNNLRLAALLILLQVLFAECGSSSTVNSLKVEGQSGWIVTDESNPRLSWQPVSNDPAIPVIGYNVIMADNLQAIQDGEANLWESGLIPVNNGPWVLFDASGLTSRTEVWWRVRPVFSKTHTGEWSEPGHFEIGLKETTDWKGKWIGMNPEERKRSAPQFKNTFSLDKPVAKARLYVCGLGWHESYLNGERLGDEVLQAAQTDYEIRDFYVAHDVTKLLNRGPNVLGLWLGDGFYNQDKAFGANGLSYGQPKVLAQLEITFQDGSKTVIATDDSWKCKVSPIIESNVYGGERYDANLADEKWASQSAVGDDWKPVVLMPEPGGTLIAQQLPPCRKLDKVQVKTVDELKPGTWIFDFGQNLVGWAKLNVEAEAGTKLTIRFAEERLPSGELNFETSGIKATKLIQTDEYTCKGGEVESWEPRFTYHGFRFAELTVTNGTLRIGAPARELLEGIVVHTDIDVIGEFECSDSTLNKAFQLAHWTQIGNIQGVPTDCPIRERCGWTGDAHNVVPYTMLRFDAASMWRKYIDDIATTAQVTGPMLCFGDEFGERTRQIKEVGIPTMVAPGKRFIGEGSPDWGCAIAFIPWDIYVRTGDMRSLKEHYESIRQWAKHLQGLSTDGLVYSGMGDWCKPILEEKNGRTDRELFGTITPMLSTACYYRSVRITADAARLLGHTDDYNYFNALAAEIRKAFTDAFYSDNPKMIPDQTINAIAIKWNVLAPEMHQKVASKLATQVQDAGYHFMTGVFGMPSLWPALSEYGHCQTVWKALQVETAPSLKYLFARGATTFWEVWPLEKDANEVYLRSMSHPFQGGFVAWFFEGLAGITPDNEVPGYRLIHLEPQVIDGLDWVNCRYRSPMGTIESSWKRTDGLLTWTVDIPLGAEANLLIPGKLQTIQKDAQEINLKAEQSDDAQGKAQRLILSSGKYTIISDLN